MVQKNRLNDARKENLQTKWIACPQVKVNESKSAWVCQVQNFISVQNIYSGTPLIRSPMGRKNLAILMGDRINKGFFNKKCRVFIKIPSSRRKV